MDYTIIEQPQINNQVITQKQIHETHLIASNALVEPNFTSHMDSIKSLDARQKSCHCCCTCDRKKFTIYDEMDNKQFFVDQRF